MDITKIINNQRSGNFDPENIIIVVTSYSEQELPQSGIDNDPIYYQGTIDFLTSLNCLIPVSLKILNDDELLEDDICFFDEIPEAIETLIQFAWAYHCLGNEEESKKLVDAIKSRLPKLLTYGEEKHPGDHPYPDYNNLDYLRWSYNNVLTRTYKIY